MSTLPIHLKKNLGGNPKSLLLGFGVAAVLTVEPLLSSPENIVDSLLHSSRAIILVVLAGILLPLSFLLRRLTTLDIDERGVKLADARRQYFYKWGDILHARMVNAGVQLDMRGQSPDQNKYNVISNRFGMKADELVAIIKDGIERWGTETSPNDIPDSMPRATSVTPGGSARSLAAEGLKRFVLVWSGVCLILLSCIIIWQVSDYYKTSLLKERGLRTTATVVRYYRNCGRRSCSMGVGYKFGENLPQYAGLRFRGTAFLAGDDYRNDKDYLYSIRTNSVPIVYDSKMPTRSELNFRDVVFRANPLKVMLAVIVIAGGSLFGVFSLAGMLIAFSMWRAMQRLPRGPKNGLHEGGGTLHS